MDASVVPERCEDLWLAGGDLVIRAENVVFKVFSAQLSVNSSVFKDMLAVPQPPAASSESYEGLPFVFMPDSAFDVTHFLKGIIYSGYADHEVGQRFAVMGAFLRMGTKYGVPYFRRLAVAKLTAIYPSKLADHHALDRDRRESLHVADYDNSMALMALSLARECSVPSIIPWCLWFHVTSYDGRDKEDFFDSLGFESEDGRFYGVDAETKYQCVKAGWALETERMTLIANNMIGRGHTPKCDQTCLRSQTQYFMLFPDTLVLFTPPALLRALWTQVWGLCDRSASEAEKAWSTRMEELWTELPSYYGLAPWEELIATSQS